MLIKKSVFFVLIITFLFACKKNDNSNCMPVEAAAEASQIAAFCTSNNISYQVDANGIYYQILDKGSGSTPVLKSLITVTYSASTLDGKIIEDKTTSPVTTQLNQFIEGWRIAIPYIQSGGRIKMVIPSSLAFGCTGVQGQVAPNTPLYYDVVLLNVQ